MIIAKNKFYANGGFSQIRSQLVLCVYIEVLSCHGNHATIVYTTHNRCASHKYSVFILTLVAYTHTHMHVYMDCCYRYVIHSRLVGICTLATLMM